MSNSTLISRIEKLSVVGLLFGVLISIPLWGSMRWYPTIPLLFKISPEITSILSIIFVVSLLAILFNYKKFVFLPVLLGVLLFLLESDLSRVQPWIYIYALLLVFIFLGTKKKISTEEVLLQILILFFSAIYIWSGLEKLNYSYFHIVVPWFMSGLSFTGLQMDFMYFLGFLAPLFEILVGLLFIFKRTRLYAFFGLLVLHLGILFLLGPLGHNFNTIVWPWNICMIFLGYFLLQTKAVIKWKEIYKEKVAVTMLGFVSLLIPFLGLLGIANPYLAYSFYSGNVTEASLIVTPVESKSIPIDESKFVKDQSGNLFLNFYDLSYSGLTVPPYPSEKFFKSVAATICENREDKASPVLLLRSRADTFTGSRVIQTLACSDL